MMMRRAAMVARARVRRRVWLADHAAAARNLTTLEGDADRREFRALAATFAAIEESRSSRDTCVSLLAQALSGLMPSTAPRDSAGLTAALFLTASQLAPPHQGVELRFGAKSFVPVLQRLSADVPWDQVLPTLPDYGAAVPLLWDQRAGPSSDSPPLTVAQVHAALVAIASEQGTGSTQRKQDRTVALLAQCHTADEMVYLVRLLAHQKLRISMGEKSILAALATACLPASLSAEEANVVKSWTDAVVTAYSQLPDYGALATLLCQLLDTEPSDLAARTQRLLEAAAPRAGVPVLTMAAYPIGSVREAVKRLRKSGATSATCEYKYDGARVQLHLSPSVRRVFSRNMEDQTDKYGALLDVIARQLKSDVTQELVMEGEVVAIDRATHELLPFQVLQTKTTTEFCLFAFDLLSINGESLLQRPLAERRRRLKDSLEPQLGHLEFVDHIDIELTPVSEEDDAKQTEVEHRVRQFLEASVAFGCEGLMVKTLAENAEYRAGARSFSWMKLKHDYLSDETDDQATTKTAKSKNSAAAVNSGTFLPDTLDLVPIAAFYGKGRRAGVFGSFLLASYDAATGNYETIGKVGSGFNDAQLIQLSEEFRREGAILKETNGDAEVPTGYLAATTAAQRPDVWLAPTQVWEIKATQLTLSPSYTAGYTQLNGEYERATPVAAPRRKSKGLALRFPRFLRVRPEKSPDQATESAQIAMLFQQQQGESTSSSPETGNGDNE